MSRRLASLPSVRLLRGLALLAGLLAFSTQARAEDPEVTRSKGYFTAGAAAYEMGDYAAAIQALAEAYRLTPLPAIAFSLAQAERRQYFVTHERERLERAIELYRGYLRDVPSAGRRADATDALAQLEPLALARQDSPDAPSASTPELTRLMISSVTPHAMVRLDDAPPTAAPLIAQVTPGSHRVRVTAQGFFPGERTAEAIEGALVPFEVSLREQPAVVELHPTSSLDLLIDGSFVGNLNANRRLELASGMHEFTFAKTGYRLQTFRQELAPGQTRTIVADLSPTGQRMAAVLVLAISGAGLIGAAVATGFALDHEHKAQQLLSRSETESLSIHQLHTYNDELEQRGRFRGVAVTGYVLSAAALVTGLCLFMFDQPDLRQTASVPHDGSIKISVPVPTPQARAWSVHGRWQF